MTDHRPPLAVEAIGRLEELARAVSPQRWRAFGGHDSNTFAITCAKTGKEVVAWTGFDGSRTADTAKKRAALEAYIAAVSPAVFLSLIESLRHSVEREAAAWAFVERVAKRGENKSYPGIHANERQEGFSDGYNEANEEVSTEARAALDRRAGT